MPQTQQCDGRKDCMNGEDETIDCGTVYFSLPLFNIIITDRIYF